jgi:hypothetical protein
MKQRHRKNKLLKKITSTSKDAVIDVIQSQIIHEEVFKDVKIKITDEGDGSYLVTTDDDEKDLTSFDYIASNTDLKLYLQELKQEINEDAKD